MSLVMVVVGVLGQALLGLFLFMLAVFAGAGAANSHPLASWQTTLLNMALVILPGLSITAAALLIYAYLHHGSSSANWWHLLPIAGAGLYVMFVLSLGSK